MDHCNPQRWLHTAKKVQEGFVVFRAKYLGSVSVEKSKGVEIVKEAIRKLKIAHQVKKAEAGNKEGKLPKVEIHISINCVKILNLKNKVMVCNRPLHRISYCADDHTDKKIFAFIAKDQEKNNHSCFVLRCEKEASNLTLSFGQAFDLAYKRYLQTEKSELKKNKEIINLGEQIEEIKKENIKFKKDFEAPVSLNSNQMDQPLNLKNRLSTSADLTSNLVNGASSENTITNDVRFSPNTENSSREIFLDTESENSASVNGFDWYSHPNTNTDAIYNHKTNQNIGPVDQFRDSNVFDLALSNTEFFDLPSPSEQDFELTHDPFADTPHWNSVVSEELGSTPSFENEIPVLNSASKSFLVNSNLNQESADVYDDVFAIRNENEAKDSFTKYLSNLAARTEHPEISDASNQLSGEAIFNTFESKFNENSFNTSFTDLNLSAFDAFNNSNIDIISPTETQTVLTPRKDVTPTETQTVLTPRKDVTPTETQTVLTPRKDVTPTETQTVLTPRKDVTPTKCEIARPRPTGSGVKSKILPAPPTKQTIKAAMALPTPMTMPAASSMARARFISGISSRSYSISNVKPISVPRTNGHILPNVEKIQSPTSDFRSRSRSAISARQQYSIFQVSKSLEDMAG